MTTTAERNDEQPPAAGGNATQAPESAALAPELAARLLRRVTLAPGEHASQPSYAPFTGELVGRVPVCTEVDVDAADVRTHFCCAARARRTGGGSSCATTTWSW